MKDCCIFECGFWVGTEWAWNLQWHRGFFESERSQIEKLHTLLESISLSAGIQDKAAWIFGNDEKYSVKSFVMAATGRELRDQR
ncbi:hypothetical protein PIB30_079094, partial [Stylosanthes scabra]|nr:hypothetical protein [Stylosanthes scabra]